MNLEERLRERIRRAGPISFYEWMKAALYDEREGYYCTDRVRQGRAGDYRTAPETSPLFAATFAHYFAKVFIDLRRPPAWTIFEAGSGGGEFAYGILNSFKTRYPEVFAATSYVIDETSSVTCRRAAERLSGFADRVTFQHLAEINNPAKAGILFSNELVDAFPVNRITTRGGRLRELYVGLKDDGFRWVSGELDERVAKYCRRIGLRLSEGQFAEINLDAEEFVSRVARLFDSGFVVTVDYGAEREELLRAPKGTLRAYRHHRSIDDFLSRPGKQDLTTTVDWTQLKEAGARIGLQTLRFERLDKFLLGEGLLELMDKLSTDLSHVDVLRLRTGAREMIMPHGLATSFQVLVQGT